MADFDRKLRFFAKQVAWTILFVIFFPLCLFGIYTGVQYANDDCVKNGSFALALDYWLIIACMYDIFFSLIVLLLLCCHVDGSKRKWIIWPMHIINVLWIIMGIGLIIESNVRCQHNTLWVISVVDVSLKGVVATSVFVVWILNKLGLCSRLGSYISFEETPYNFNPAWEIDQLN